MAESQISIELDRRLLDSSSETEGPHNYLLERLKYENLLKEQAIFKASKLIQELKEEADMLRHANHQLTIINANKTNEIKELERMLRSYYHEGQHERNTEELMNKLREKQLKIRKLQLIIRNTQSTKAQENTDHNYRTIDHPCWLGDTHQREHICKTEADVASPTKALPKSFRGHRESPNRKYFSSATGKNVAASGKNHSTNNIHQTRTVSTTKKRQPSKQNNRHTITDGCKTEPALQQLEIEVNRLRNHIQEKDEQILLLMKRNKTLKQNDAVCTGDHGQKRYRNPRDYHLHKMQSHTTSSTVYPC